VAGRRARFYDGSELFLEIAIVLSSISLLSGSLIYWRSSFLFSAVGIAGILWGLLAVH
jgi:1,4-dihydroxy-2-naphthoate octaprenyltransferase